MTMTMTDKRKPWRPDQSVEFTYKRGGNEGDITVFANDQLDAARIIRQFGFPMTDLSHIVQTGQKLTDYLKSCNCPTCGKPK